MQALLTLALLLFASNVAADCDGLGACGAIVPVFDGEECGVDPADNSKLGIYQGFCPCQQGEPLECTVTYTGVDGAASTLSTSTNFDVPNSASYFTFDFPATNTAIESGSPVTVVYSFTDGEYPPFGFTYSPVQSIVYTAATETVTETDSTVTTSTTTTTATTTTALPQSTSTQPCTTGTFTKTARTSTTTSTSTITQPPKTVFTTKVSTTTTRLSCIPAPSAKSKPSSPRLRARDFLSNLTARAQGDEYEVPYCPAVSGAPSTTTMTTTTSMRTDTVTITDTQTSTMTATVEETATPTPRTTTVCNNVKAKVTITPTKTKTVHTRLPTSTITSTKIKVVTRTIFDGGKPQVCAQPKTCTAEGASAKVVKPTAVTTPTGK